MLLKALCLDNGMCLKTSMDVLIFSSANAFCSSMISDQGEGILHLCGSIGLLGLVSQPGEQQELRTERDRLISV